MKTTALQIEDYLQGAQLASVYVLCGDDESLIDVVLSALRSKNESEDRPGSTRVEYETVDDHRRVFDDLYTQPFLGMNGKRMVVVRGGVELAQSAPEQLTEYAQNPSPSSVLVLCCEKLDRRRNPGRKLSENAVWVDCSRVRWSDARRWVRKEAGRCGKKLESAAEYALVKAVGPHISALKNELDKLVLYVGEREVIDQHAVDEIVPASRSRSVFELSDAIARSDSKEAVALGERLLLHGETPEMIIAFLGGRMRELWRVARLARRRTPPQDIARGLSVPEFAVKRALQAVRSRDDRWFASRLSILAEADAELKTSSLPSRRRPVWLTAIMCELCGS